MVTAEKAAVACPCGAKYEVPRAALGKSTNCPKCRQRFFLSEIADPAAAWEKDLVCAPQNSPLPPPISGPDTAAPIPAPSTPHRRIDLPRFGSIVGLVIVLITAGWFAWPRVEETPEEKKLLVPIIAPPATARAPAPLNNSPAKAADPAKPPPAAKPSDRSAQRAEVRRHIEEVRRELSRLTRERDHMMLAGAARGQIADIRKKVDDCSEILSCLEVAERAIDPPDKRDVHPDLHPYRLKTGAVGPADWEVVVTEVRGPKEVIVRVEWELILESYTAPNGQLDHCISVLLRNYDTTDLADGKPFQVHGTFHVAGTAQHRRPDAFRPRTGDKRNARSLIGRDQRRSAFLRRVSFLGVLRILCGDLVLRRISPAAERVAGGQWPADRAQLPTTNH